MSRIDYSVTIFDIAKIQIIPENGKLLDNFFIVKKY